MKDLSGSLAGSQAVHFKIIERFSVAKTTKTEGETGPLPREGAVQLLGPGKLGGWGRS